MKKTLSCSFIFYFNLFICLAGLASCAAQPEKAGREPVKVIFDNDMGNDIDDALAIDMLYKYADAGIIDLIGITSNKVEPASVEYIDILNNFYGYPDIPVGRLTGVEQYDRPNSYALQTVADPSYKRSIGNYDSLPESVDLLRRLLAAQQDSSVVIIATGFSTNLARLMDSKADASSELDGMELIRRKVKHLHMMAGDFRQENPIQEHNVVFDIPAAQHVYDSWPTPITTSPFDVGEKILYPVESILNDFGFTDKHPVVEAYKVYKKMPYSRPTWDLTSVLYAIEPDSGYFEVVGPGRVHVDGKSITTFTPEAGGPHFYLAADSLQRERIRNRFVEIITREPAALSRETER